MNTKDEKVINLLDATRSEMDTLRADLAKERSESELQFNALKQQLHVSIDEMKTLLEGNTSLGDELNRTLLAKLSELQTQLNQPKDSLIENLKDHLYQIRQKLLDLLLKIEKQSPRNETLEHVKNTLHRFRIKFEIVKLKFALGKMDFKDAASNAKLKTTKKILALRRFIHENEEVAKKNWRNFRHEIDEAYDDLQKAIH